MTPEQIRQEREMILFYLEEDERQHEARLRVVRSQISAIKAALEAEEAEDA